jgi:hypothetical protein
MSSGVTSRDARRLRLARQVNFAMYQAQVDTNGEAVSKRLGATGRWNQARGVDDASEGGSHGGVESQSLSDRNVHL